MDGAQWAGSCCDGMFIPNLAKMYLDAPDHSTLCLVGSGVYAGYVMLVFFSPTCLPGFGGHTC